MAGSQTTGDERSIGQADLNQAAEDQMAREPTNGHPVRVQLRRYPNRRYYDAARSQHLTLEDIFRLICDGQEVQINDSKTGDDITARVLAQIILDQAPGKLVALPAELLHQIIRSNESLLREFVEKYFYGALKAFLESQRELDRYLRRAMGLAVAGQEAGALPGQGFPFFSPHWAAMLMGPFGQTPFVRALLAGGVGLDGGGDRPPGVEPDPGRGDEQSDVWKAVEELKQQVDALRKEFRSGHNGR